MNKINRRILVVGASIVVLLASFSTVVGLQSASSTSEGSSPLFTVRTEQVVQTGCNRINDEQMSFTGETLYVGGTGPGNYTRIQEAIDDAAAGDTIYVYAGVYYENVVVDKSLILTGEDKERVIIDGGGHGEVVRIAADNITITGFTIQHGQSAGIGFGYMVTRHAVIRGNKIMNNKNCGIRLVPETSKNKIQENTIINNKVGLSVEDEADDIITNNHIANNKIGIQMLFAFWNEIKGNNFVENDEHAFFVWSFQNCWDRNYWDDAPRVGPKVIRGCFLVYKTPSEFFEIPWLNFDWHPASDPYDM